MPASRPLTSQSEIRAEELAEHDTQRKLLEIEEELTLYDPSGPWRFFETRLTKLARAEEEALVNCPIEEVEGHRAKLKLIRHLANTPDVLRGQRARILGEVP